MRSPVFSAHRMILFTEHHSALREKIRNMEQIAYYQIVRIRLFLEINFAFTPFGLINSFDSAHPE